MPAMAAFSTSIAGYWSTRTTRGGVTIWLQKDRFPLVLSDHAEDLEQPDTGTDRNRLVISTRILKTSILVVTVAAIVLAILSVGNPLVLSSTLKVAAVTGGMGGIGQGIVIALTQRDFDVVVGR